MLNLNQVNKYSRRSVLTLIPGAVIALFGAGCSVDDVSSITESDWEKYQNKQDEFRDTGLALQKAYASTGQFLSIRDIDPLRDLNEMAPYVRGDLSLGSMKPEFSYYRGAYQKRDGFKLWQDTIHNLSGGGQSLSFNDISNDDMDQILADASEFTQKRVLIKEESGDQTQRVDITFILRDKLPQNRFFFVYSHSVILNNWYFNDFTNGGRFVEENKEPVVILRFNTSLDSRIGASGFYRYDSLIVFVTDAQGVPVAKTRLDKNHHTRSLF